MTICRSYTFLTKRKDLPNIYSVRIVNNKSCSSSWLVLAEWLTEAWLVYLQKSTIYMTYITTYTPSGAHMFNAAWTTLHMLHKGIHVLRKWPQNIPRSLHTLVTWSWLVAWWIRSPYRMIENVLKQDSSWGDAYGIHITWQKDTYLLTLM
jgi:hypothetical protein